MNNYSIKNISKQQIIYFSLLIMSMLFFIRKGIQYALLDNYIPLVSVMPLFLIISLSFKKKTAIPLRLWGILLLIWASVRITLTLANSFLAEITNCHIHHQLGLLGFLISLIFLFTGAYLFKKAKSFNHNIDF